MFWWWIFIAGFTATFYGFWIAKYADDELWARERYPVVVFLICSARKCKHNSRFRGALRYAATCLDWFDDVVLDVVRYSSIVVVVTTQFVSLPFRVMCLKDNGIRKPSKEQIANRWTTFVVSCVMVMLWFFTWSGWYDENSYPLLGQSVFLVGYFVNAIVALLKYEAGFYGDGSRLNNAWLKEPSSFEKERKWRQAIYYCLPQYRRSRF